MDTPRVIRIVIADDHRLFLDGLRRLLEEQPDLHIVGVTENGAATVAAVLHEKPDILLLDIDMPDCNAFAVVDRLQQEMKEIPRIILLTMHNELPCLIAASRPDVQGFVLKDAAFEELIEAIHHVQRGERFVSKSVAGILTEKGPLSNREQDVLRCAANGMTTQKTSETLNISVKTVETHRAHILKKLAVPNMTTAVHRMNRTGL